MAKNKLERFAEMKNFPHVFEPTLEQAFNRTFRLQGKWKAEFFNNQHPLILELGCGKGEYTVNLARKFPQQNFIGVDIKGARMWKGAKASHQEGLSNVAFLRTHIEHLPAFFGTGEVDEIWLTFPDPQLKKMRKRLSSARFLNDYRNFLKPEGPVHLKTDSKFLHNFTYRLIRLNNLPLITASRDIYKEFSDDQTLTIKTFYEQQFLYFHIPITYLKFLLKGPSEITNPEEDKEAAQKEKEYRDQIMPKIPVQGKPRKDENGVYRFKNND